LHGPIDLAITPIGHLLVANSDGSNADPNQPSELEEFTTGGQFVSQFSVDPNNGGAFGIATFTVYFGALRVAAVNDNANTLSMWTTVVHQLSCVPVFDCTIMRVRLEASGKRGGVRHFGKAICRYRQVAVSRHGPLCRGFSGDDRSARLDRANRRSLNLSIVSPSQVNRSPKSGNSVQVISHRRLFPFPATLNCSSPERQQKDRRHHRPSHKAPHIQPVYYLR
jgi:hypothetical protein